MSGTTGIGSNRPRTAVGSYSLAVDLRLDLQGGVVATEAVGESDLADAYGEIWWASQLRTGHPEVRLEETVVTLRPAYLAGREPTCTGFTLEATNPKGRSTACSFERDCVLHVAERAAGRLREAGVLKFEETYFYELRAERRLGPEAVTARPASASATGSAIAAGVRLAVDRMARSAPVATLRLPLGPLLDRARPVGRRAGADPEADPEADLETDPETDLHDVFYTHDALERAERIARHGEESDPVVETGGLLVGPLCSCPETGAMFVVVTDVLEATRADQSGMSLYYSSRTWARLQTVLETRRRLPGHAADRILGQMHTHPFRPGGGKEFCDSCSKVDTCRQTSAFLSQSDLDWCRAVFSGQPWQLSHIFGLDVRGERAAVFYGLYQGRLQRRGYHLIADFAPAVHCTESTRGHAARSTAEFAAESAARSTAESAAESRS